MTDCGLKLLGCGLAIPRRIVTNDDLAGMVETNDTWIRERTGIQQRYYIDPAQESVSQMSIHAAKMAVDEAGIDVNDIGLIIVSTFTADSAMPNCACLVQAALGMESTEVMAYDLSAACSGFVYAVATAHAVLQTMPGKYALLIGAEAISQVMDMQDRSSCILFGDGAGAVLFGLDADKRYAQVLGARGDTEGLLVAPGTTGVQRYMSMKGKDVFRFALQVVPPLLQSLAAKAGMSVADFDHIVCHQANARILDGVAKRLHVPEARFFKNIERFGNTSAASIPIALAEMWSEGRLQSGECIALAGFGGGLTWGGICIEC